MVNAASMVNDSLNRREVLRIITLFCTTALTFVAIAGLCNCHHTTVGRVVHQWEHYVPVDDIVKPPRAGRRQRNRALSAEEQRKLAPLPLPRRLPPFARREPQRSH